MHIFGLLDLKTLIKFVGGQDGNLMMFDIDILKLLKKGDIKFKKKTFFMVSEYNELFQRLKKESNQELRKTLRRNLENKRKQIMLADNVYVENFFAKF